VCRCCAAGQRANSGGRARRAQAGEPRYDGIGIRVAGGGRHWGRTTAGRQDADAQYRSDRGAARVCARRMEEDGEGLAARKFSGGRWGVGRSRAGSRWEGGW